MARNMTEEKAAEYLRTRNRLSSCTKDALERRYKLIASDVKRLYEEGSISTTSPKSLTEKDFVKIIEVRSQKGRSACDLNHYISALNKLMLFCENHNGEEALAKNPDLRPQVTYRRLNPLPDSTYDAILSKYGEIDKTDFHLVRPFALVLMYIGTGCRNKELRLAEISDLDMRKWTVRIRHPKGENSYGDERQVFIPDEIRPVLEHYLVIRKDWLHVHGVVDSGALFFAMDGKYSFMSSNSVRRLKDKVADMIGVKFELRDCRRACGQRYLENGVPLPVVAKTLGHKTTRTTEQYYVGLTDDMTIQGLQGMWARKPDAGTDTDEEDGKA